MSELERQAQALRERMAAAGCAFDFIVRAWNDTWAPGDAAHRAILVDLFAQVRDEAGRRRAAVLRDRPDLADEDHWFALHVDLDRAVPKPWDTGSLGPADRFRHGVRVHVGEAQDVSAFGRLFQSFDDPPYGLNPPYGLGSEAESLFPAFCETVGLMPGEDAAVLDWVGSPDREPERSTWSNYFDAGKEWWGIWCLTVWNPRRRTLAALAASTTD